MNFRTLRLPSRFPRWSAVLLAALLGLCSVPVLAGMASPLPVGTLIYRWQLGNYVDNGWLCYGWSNGVYHCTTHWHYAPGSKTPVSEVPAWVPSGAGGSAPASVAKTGNVTSVGNAPAVSLDSSVRFCTGAVDFSNAAQWATPHGCYGQIFSPNPARFPARPSWGWCNWVAEESHLNFGGYAALYQPKHFGAPRVNAVVWFAPGDQGASSDGHWANLVAIGPNGWGLVEEMNFYFRGGGFTKVDYRFIRLYAGGTAYLY